MTTQQASSADGAGQYLIFSLRGEKFALGILCIREIIEYRAVTEMPLMPDAVRGVINLRGAVVPVIDLAARFNRGRTDVQRRACIVIVEVRHAGASQAVGVLVDGVTQVVDIPESDIEAPPSFGSRLRADFIAGMAKIDEQFVIVIDVARALSMGEIAELGSSVATAAPQPSVASLA